MDLPTDVAASLEPWVAGARAALGDRWVGAYLVGSFALGCAHEWSDVDVLAVTDGRLDDATTAALRTLHARLPDAGGWAAHLEGSYADLADLRSPMTLGRRWPYVDHGSRELVDSSHDNTAHARWLLREHGVVLAGPDPRDLVAEVTAAAPRAEALGLARARAEELEDDPAPYGDAWWQPQYVLTSCRILYTATVAEVTGKAAAARWALDRLDAVHHPVVEAALADRAHRWERVHQQADPALTAPTRALVWDVVRLAGQAALEARD
ncbi:aminoglycoside adenylyltransferase domain-containing protein [Nocardioides rubriscoriae]|uniref:aminoglycoside adenylyltransferase domain-containing protein n=1 Tax=Nocardioides rubriscoriae TaxID=642762 RepID=UPI0011DF957E|nr:aminoglycoside adenylyltransferase domain-containing protein [Nocardioides rubriscoriae]